MARIILSVLNLVAGAAFLYLGLMVREKQSQWSLAVLQFEIGLQGLPVEDAPGGSASDPDAPVPFKITVNNEAFFVEKVKRSTLQNLLPKVAGPLGGSEVVASQVAELARVEKIIEGQTRNGDRATQRAALLKYLQNLARTGRERDGAAALLRDLFVPNRAALSRRSVHFAAADEGSANALAPLAVTARLSDPMVERETALAELRSAVGAFVRAESLALIPATTAGAERADLTQRLANAADAFAQALAGGDIAQTGSALVEAAPPASRDQAKRLVDAASPAADPSETGLKQLATSLEAYALTAAKSPAAKDGVRSLARIVSDPSADPEPQAVAAGQALLTRFFEEAKSPAPADVVDQRRAIAHVLYHLDADVTFFAPPAPAGDSLARADAEAGILARSWQGRIEWHQRVRFVVGARTYNAVAGAQVTRLQLAARRVQDLIVSEQSAFVPVYDQLRQRASGAAASLEAARSLLTTEKALQDKYVAELNERKAERGRLDTELGDLRSGNAALAADLAKREARLLALQLEIVGAQDELLRIEAQLRQLESRLVPASRNR